MRILAVSDRVVEPLTTTAIVEYCGRVDLVLACGDLPPAYLEAIRERLSVPLLYVLGNHDQGVHTADGTFRDGPVGGTHVDGRVVEVRGVLIAGLDGSMRYSPRGRHQYTEGEMRRKVLALTPALWLNRLRHGRFLDILITHAPPYGIHDGDDLCHTGFRAFRRLMERYRPRYLIHGHQHIYSPSGVVRTRYRETEVINAYGHQIIEVAVEERP